MNRLKIVTIATEVNNSFISRFLIPSCAKNKLSLTILSPDTREWKGYSSKTVTMARYLQNVDENDLLMFTDGYDSLFLKGEDEILAAYEKFDRDLVFSGEYNCWPLGMVGQTLYGDYSSSKFPYLNSGGYIGKAGMLKSLIEKYDTPPVEEFPVLKTLESHGHNFRNEFNWSDQFYWTLIYLLERNSISIDHDGDIFEFYGPEISNVFVPLVNEREKEFAALGCESNLYKSEYQRLEKRLPTRSKASQIHFAGLITKTIFSDMHDSSVLPSWITDNLTSPADREYAEIVPV